MLQDFLHKLFVTKWNRYGSRIHNVLRLFEVVFLAALVVLAMWLKEAPRRCLEQRWLPHLILFLSIPLLEEDLRARRATTVT